MARQLKEGVGTVWVHAESGGIQMVAFAEGDDIPAWAAKQMGAHCFDDGESDEDDIKPYAKWKKADLEAEVADRNERRDDDDLIDVEGNGTIADLAAALDADDAANAE